MRDTYDPQERAREKEASRERDERDLAEGRVTPDDLSRENGFFASLDLKRARIRLRRR